MNSPSFDGRTGFGGYCAARVNTPSEAAVCDGFAAVTPAKRSMVLPRLIGQAFEALPPPQRRAILSHLLKPLGMLSLATIGNGVFLINRSQLLLQNAAAEAEYLQDIDVNDVVELVDRVQQVSVEVVDAVAQMIEASPDLAHSPLIAILEQIPLRRKRTRQVDDALI